MMDDFFLDLAPEKLNYPTTDEHTGLYHLCIWRTSQLLMNSSQNETTINTKVRNNPFCNLPASIINDLVDCSVSSRDFDATKMHPLLSSGQVTRLKLYNTLLSRKELESILTSLSVACQNLHSIILKRLYFTDLYLSIVQTKINTSALECVLSTASLLEVVESCVEFDLKAIRNCDRLKVLKIHFRPKSTYFAFLKELDDGYMSHTYLSVFEIFEDWERTTMCDEIATVLKYCPNLTQTNANISQSLELLYNFDMNENTLTTQHKLQKCRLGGYEGSATLASVYIATVTCPLIEDLDIVLNNNKAVYTVSKFQNLSSLLIKWETPGIGDFQKGLRLMLEIIGPNLKNLGIINFNSVDFFEIAAKCPIIEELKVKFGVEFRGCEVPSECFKGLKTLYINCTETQFGCFESTLTTLLSSTVNLTRLHLHAAILSDRVLEKVFKKNSLPKLKAATILDSTLTEEGVRNLIEHMKMLEFFRFSSSQIGFAEAKIIVRSINPNVDMTSEFDNWLFK